MIGKILGAVVGAKAAEHSTKVGGAGGALLGVAGATLLRRLSLPALVALTAGGYAFKKWSDKKDAAPARASAAKPATPAKKSAARKPRKPASRTPKAANAA
jgi:hypothetical protein